ncbi:hypothetical protein Tco_1572006, partial [Tanacetum coccineum]
MEVRWCGCDDGGSYGGVEDEARGGVWSGRSDRSGGGERGAHWKKKSM